MKYRVLEKCVETFWVILSTSATVVTGIIAAVVGIKSNTSMLPFIMTLFFLLSISVVLSQILIELHLLRRAGEAKNVRLVDLYLRSDSSLMMSQLETLLKEDGHKKKELTIICYGSSGFGEMLVKIANGDYGNNITVDALFYDPNSKQCITEEDSKAINTVIEKINTGENKENVKTNFSRCPPTIRACVVKNDNDEYIWCSIQPYFFEASLRYVSYDDSIAIIGKKEKDYETTKDMANVVEKEFKRLRRIGSASNE